MELRGQLGPDQIARLLKPIKPNRVYTAQGQSHVAAWEIKAHLDRMFGFCGWEKEIVALDCISEARGPDIGLKDKDNWYVTYRCHLRLSIFDGDGRLMKRTDDVATGTAQNQPSLGDAHDFAVKNAVSYALKRCAVELGDQFGLSLYNKGQTGALVRMTLVGNPGDEEPDVPVSGEDHDPDVLPGGDATGDTPPVAEPIPSQEVSSVSPPGNPDPPSEAQLRMANTLMRNLGIMGPARHKMAAETLNLAIEPASLKDLSRRQISHLIDGLQALGGDA